MELQLLAGAHGYILKKSLATELLAAIQAVHRGNNHLAPLLAEALVESKPAAVRPMPPAGFLDRLTEREREVMNLVALGHTNAEVGGKLYISSKTVETHRKNLILKLNLKTRADLVRFAIEHGVLET